MKTREQEIVQYYIQNGTFQTLKEYNIKHATLNRYIRVFKSLGGKMPQGIEKGIITTDIHLDHKVGILPVVDLVLRFAKDFKPDKWIDLGDFFDFSYISSYNEKALKKLEGSRFAKDYKLGNELLDRMQSCAKEVVMLEGNHDERCRRVVNAAPWFEGLIEVENNLHLDDRKIEYIEMKDQPYRLGKLSMIHGWHFNEFYTKKHLEKWGQNIVSGHCHRAQRYSKTVPSTDEHTASWGLGCLTDISPEYRNGTPTGHEQGFAVYYMDRETGHFNLYPIDIIDNKFIFEGKIYD